MQIELAYGKSGLRLELPEAWNISVIEPKYLPGLPDPEAALQQALRAPLGCPPLKERVTPGMRVGIVFSDITRPAPHKLILPAVLRELESIAGVQVTLFNALGTHRPNTADELGEMLGEALAGSCRIVQNDAFDPGTQTRLGTTTSGNEVWLNRELAECDLKVLTGFIEPHMFAGFSGGGKALLPGMAGQASVLNNHRASLIADPRATWGVTQGNPIYAEIQEAAGMAGETFLVNVTLNKHKQITGVFAGELNAAHAAGCSFARESAMAAVAAPFDIVLTSNSGYPLDLNVYQAVKGMSAAAQVVRPGGAILMTAECWDGIPEHGQYAATAAPGVQPGGAAGDDPEQPACAGPLAGADPGAGAMQGGCVPVLAQPERSAGARGAARAVRGDPRAAGGAGGEVWTSGKDLRPAGRTDDDTVYWLVVGSWGLAVGG